jgi:peptidoglycan/xylan/chitin deacetylase (PgdA/CDA1 family)
MGRAAEKIVAEGGLVFSHAYDRGEPGAVGCGRIQRLNGRFATWTLDDGVQGPFRSLAEALDENDMEFVSQFCTEIIAPELSAEEVVALLYSEPQVDGHRFRVNGEEWESRAAGGFRRAGTQA